MIDSKLPAGCEEAARRPPTSGVATATSTRRPRCTPNYDLLTATHMLVDDFLPKRRGPGRLPRITDAELITLAIAQVFMGLPNDRQFLALAGYRLSHLFAYLPRQSGYNKRLRALTHRSSERSTTSPSARRGGAISCGCSIRPRSPARPRARRFGAPSSRGSQPTATAALTRGTSGAFASICSARSVNLA